MSRLPQRWKFLLFVALAGAMLGFLPPGAGAADQVSLQLMWKDQAQFAGYYLAQDAGIYQRHGLEVTLLPGGPHVAALTRLAEGKCDFAVAWLSHGIMCRDAGNDIVLISQVVSRSGLMLVALKSSGITRLEDLEGRDVAMWNERYTLAVRALLENKKVRVREVPQLISMSLLLQNAVQAACATRYNEYHILLQSGLDPEQLVTFEMADFGFNFPEDGIYTTGRNWTQRPDLCRRFVQASLEGWKLAAEKPELALDSVMRRIKERRLATNRAHQAWMLKEMNTMIEPGQGPMGVLKADDYALVCSVLLEHGGLRQPLPLKRMAVGPALGEDK